MARIQATQVKTHRGLQVLIDHPEIKDAEELLKISQLVVDINPYMLSETPEFTYTVEQERAIINAYLTHPSEFLIVARVDGKIIGMLSFRVGFRRKISHHGEIGMAVHPDFLNLGVGQVLLNSVIQWATDHPYLEQIRLQVFKRNQVAINLYEKNHFEVEGVQVGGVKYLDGTYDDVICMVRHLNKA